MGTMRNRYQIIVISLLALWHGAIPAEQMLNDDAIVLYSLGYQLGTDLKEQELDLNKDILLQGIQDAIKGNPPWISDDIQRQALAAVKKQQSENNLRKAEAFLTANGKLAGVTTTPSGLQYRIIQAGEGKTPGPEDRVTVAYRGTLIDGTEFASSAQQGKPVTLQVNKIIKGLSEALQMMPLGSKWQLYLHPKLGYGNRSPGKKVPANSALIYEVELLTID